MTDDDFFSLPPLCPVHHVRPEYAADPKWCTCDDCEADR